jgi:hypothetical protein
MEVPDTMNPRGLPDPKSEARAALDDAWSFATRRGPTAESIRSTGCRQLGLDWLDSPRLADTCRCLEGCLSEHLWQFRLFKTALAPGGLRQLSVAVHL